VCVAQEKADAARTDVAKTNEARFAQALVTNKLEPITLERIGLGPSSIDPMPGFKNDQVTTAEVRGATVSAIGVYEDSCGGVPVELARRGTQIVRINRKRTAGTSTGITVCGCVNPHFTCGGMRVTFAPVGYVLPANTTFGGVVEVAYATDEVTLAPDHPCPYAPPPP
jgi:hypothetical protein